MATLSTTAPNKAKAAHRTLLAVFCALTLIGLVSWVLQLSQGLDTLGIGQVITWGLYIVAFFLLAGIASGLMILAALGDLGILPAVRQQRRGLLIAAVACFIGAGVMILMDLGRPERVFNFLLLPNFSSMFIWDFYSLALSVVVALICLFKGPNKVLGAIAGFLAVAVVIVEGWILTVSAGNPYWHNALIPIVFLVEALILAVAAVLLVGGRGAAFCKGFGRILPALLLLALILSLSELVTARYAGASGAALRIRLLLSGSLAPFYWIQLILGIAVPVLLLIGLPGNDTAVRAASALAIVGVFAAKVCLAVAGQAIPLFGSEAVYAPTLIEIGGFAGGLGLAGFLALLGNMLLPGKKKASG